MLTPKKEFWIAVARHNFKWIKISTEHLQGLTNYVSFLTNLYSQQTRAAEPILV